MNRQRKDIAPRESNCSSRLLIALCLLVCASIFPGALFSQTDEEVFGALVEMERASGEAVEVTVSLATGLATFISPRVPIPVGEPGLKQVQDADDVALGFVALYGGAFGVRDPSQVVVERVQGPNPAGVHSVRLHQVKGGVAATGGELSVHLRGSSVLSAHVAMFPGLQDVDVVPTVPSELAVSMVEEMLAKHYGLAQAVPVTVRLEIFNRGVLDGVGRPTQLVWFVETDSDGIGQRTWVDAHRGGVVLTLSRFTAALDRTILRDGNDIPVRSEGSPPSGDADVDTAYIHLGDAYDYFWQEHGRDSYDGAGAPIVTVVHCPDSTMESFRARCPNALWNGRLEQSFFCDGLPLADDVVAHEFTHGVTQFEADLEYYRESGALNESFSDIFGEMVDLTNGRGTDSLDVRWEIGEDDPNSGAIRHMMHPGRFGDPEKVRDPSYECTSYDNYGVHINSAVPNRAFALMADGDGDGIEGIGLQKAVQLHYHVLTERLSRYSKFVDHYNALNQGCAEFIGTLGITEADCAEVRKALDAVEMFVPTCPTAAPTPCGSDGILAKDHFFDDLESILFGGWKPTTEEGPNHWTGGSGMFNLYHDYAPVNGQFHFWGRGTERGDSSVEMDQDVDIPAGSQWAMEFDHWFEFEVGGYYYDGGVVEYSTDAGTTWQDGFPLFRNMGSGTFFATLFGDNPLAGRMAIVDRSHGNVTEHLDLSSLAGQTVRFRFRMGTDTDGDSNWVIDNIRIFECTSIPKSEATKLTANDGKEFATFGKSVAIGGDTVVVGAPSDVVTVQKGEGTTQQLRSGSAYVFMRLGNDWIPRAKLVASDAEAFDLFGRSVATDGQTIVISSEGDDDLGRESGAAYVYRWNDFAWVEVAKLVAGECSEYLEPGTHHLFEFVEAPDISWENARREAQGRRRGTRSGHLATLTSEAEHLDVFNAFQQSGWLGGSDAETEGVWQWVVGPEGGQVFWENGPVGGAYAAWAVGEPSNQGMVADEDFLMLWGESGSWNDSHDPILPAQQGIIEGYYVEYETDKCREVGFFGRSVAVGGDTVVVGHDGDDEMGPDCGAAHVFRYKRTEGVYEREAKLFGVKELDNEQYTETFVRFGNSVAVRGHTVAVRAPLVQVVKQPDAPPETPAPPDPFWAVFVYEWESQTGNWVYKQRLTAEERQPGDIVGREFLAIAEDEKTIVVGDTNGGKDGVKSGAAYVFEKQDGAWQEVAKLLPMAPQRDADGGLLAAVFDGHSGDVFGRSVAVSTQTVNGKQMPTILVGSENNRTEGTRAGAVYVFRKRNGTWGAEERITAADGSPEDTLGTSVAISGEAAVVGASGDDDRGSRSGSAYVFADLVVSFAPPSATSLFRRGDGDTDGVISVGDAIFNLSYQFLGAVHPRCLDALDFNDDGRIDPTDPIGNLGHQFLGHPGPSPPGKENCGADPTTQDGFDCATYPAENC